MPVCCVCQWFHGVVVCDSQAVSSSRNTEHYGLRETSQALGTLSLLATGLTTIAPSRLHLRPRHTQQYTYIHIIVIIKNTERKGEEAQEQSGSGHWTPKRYGWTRDRREDDTCERHTDTQTHKTLGQPRALPHIVPHYATQGHAPNPVAPPAPTVPRAQTTAETTQTGDMG